MRVSKNYPCSTKMTPSITLRIDIHVHVPLTNCCKQIAKFKILITRHVCITQLESRSLHLFVNLHVPILFFLKSPR